MSHWLDEPESTHDVVRIPIVWLTVVLSIIIHALILFFVIPHTKLLGPGDEQQDLLSDRLQVELAAQAKQAPPPPDTQLQTPQPQLPLRAERPRRPIMVEHPRGGTQTFQMPAEPPPEPVPAEQAPPKPSPPQPTPPVEGDFLSYLQGRRPATGVPDSSPGDREKAEFDQKIAANLPQAQQGTAIRNAAKGGGIFEITRDSYDDGAIKFLGFNEDMGRETPQLIEVRLGHNANMHIAIVRQMIVIIRARKKGDFEWISGRTGRSFVLSARPEDNTALEAFLMRDMFEEIVPVSR